MLNSDLWQQFRATGDPKIREKLIEANMSLVGQVVRGFRGVRPQDREDLMSAGAIGLIKAVDTWDGLRMPWDKFARLTIRYACIDQIRSCSWVPKGLRAQADRIDTAEEALAARLKRQPTVEELAGELNLPPEELETLLTATRATDWNIASLDYRQDTETPWTESVADRSSLGEDPAAKSLRAEQREMLEGLLERLPERERFVIEQSYFAGRKDVDIAMDLAVHASRISQIEVQALERLRSFAKQTPLRLAVEEVAA